MATSSKRYIFGVKIYVAAPWTGLSTDADIGLYVTGETCELRWVQNTVSAAETWKVGIINEDGIGEIKSSADFTLGGGVAKIDGMELSITNIIGTTPFWKKLVDARTGGLSLIGCACEIVEFDTTGTPDTQTIVYHGVVESAPTWDITSYRIRISEPYYKRDILVGKLVDTSDYPNADENSVGKLVPITFGEIRPLYDVDGNRLSRGYAKAIKIASKQVVWDTGDAPALFAEPNGLFSFPMVLKTSTTVYSFELADFIVVTLTGIDFVGMYALVTDGTASVGSYRKITNQAIESTTIGGVLRYVVQLTFNSVFETDLDTTNWIQIVDIDRQFKTDTWPCKGIIDSYGVALPKNPELYLIDNNIWYSVPEFTYNLLAGSNNTTLNINGEYFEQTPDSVVSYKILPITNLQYMGDSVSKVYSDWAIATFLPSVSGKVGDGIYTYVQHVGETCTVTYITQDSLALNYCGDKLKASCTQITYRQADSHALGQVNVTIKGVMPPPPEDFEFDGVYFLVYSDGTYTTVSGTPGNMDFSLAPYLKRFRGTTASFNGTNYPSYIVCANGQTGKISNINDEYYIDDPAIATNNNDFYKLVKSGAGLSRTGYKLYNYSGITSPDIYKAYNNLLLVINTAFEGSAFSADVVVKIYETAVIFAKTLQIDQEIYTPFQGRTFNDTGAVTFSDRYGLTSTDMINTVPAIFEHICRLQNWDVDAKVAGQEYWDGAHINTASFDALNIAPYNEFQPARQIIDEGEARSGVIKESLCKQFFLCNRTDTSGNECLSSIHKLATTPDVAITLSEILPDSISSLEEIGVESIFCEPIVRYAYNSATDKYDGIIRVTNTNQFTYASAYVSGLTGSEAEDTWDLCHALYTHYHMVTDPPQDMTDCKWIRTLADAKRYLDLWLTWMGAYNATGTNAATVARKRRFSFDVPYALAMTIGAAHTPWYVSMRLNITLPHQTNDSTLQCIVEEIGFDVNGGKATATVLCYDMTTDTDIQYYVKDSTDSYAGVGWPDWKDTTSTKAEAPTNGNDIKDVT